MKTVGFLPKSCKPGVTNFPARTILSIFWALRIVGSLIQLYNYHYRKKGVIDNI